MKLFLTFLSVLIAYSSIAQIDSIESEILNYKSSKPEIISKGRRLLIDKLAQDDYQKVKEIKDYLVKYVDDIEYHSFELSEYQLLLYFTQDYDELLANIEGIAGQKNGYSNSPVNYIVPVSDQLSEILVNKVCQSRDLLKVVIGSYNLRPEEVAFLRINLDYCLFTKSACNITQDSLNIQSDRFIVNYPLSIYTPYVKKVIQYKEKVADFGFGYDFFIGYGFFTGNAGKNMNDYAPMGFSMDMNYKFFVLNTSFGFGFSKLNQSIVYQGTTWEREFSINFFYPQVTLGCTFFNDDRFNFTPFAGIYSLMITPSYNEIQKNPALTDVYIQSDASFAAGFSLNLFSKPANRAVNYHRSYQYQGYAKLKYTYYKSGFKAGLSDFAGDMHTITFAFGGLMKRVYKI